MLRIRAALGVAVLCCAAATAADVTAAPRGFQPRSARWTRVVPAGVPDGWTNWNISEDGATYGATLGDGTIVFMDVRSGREIVRIERFPSSIHDTAVSADGGLYALTLDAGSVEIYSAAERRKVGEFPVLGGYCCSLGFSGDDRWLLAEDNGTMILWDVRGGAVRSRFDPGLGRSVYTFASRRARYAAVFTTTPSLLDLEGRRVIGPLTGIHRDAALFSPDERFLAGAAATEEVIVWEAASGREAFRLAGGAPLQGFAFSPDSRWLAAAASNGAVRFLDLRTGRVAHETRIPDPSAESGAFFHLRFDRSGRSLAAIRPGSPVWTFGRGE